MNNNKSVTSHSIREPLVRVVKRTDISKFKAFLIKLIAILIACVICLVVLKALSGHTVSKIADAITSRVFGTTHINRVVAAYSSNPLEGFFRGLLSSSAFWRMIREAMVLLCVALALTPAFKMRFWNTGGEGQILVGGLATATVMLFCAEKLSPVLLILAMLLASVAAGLIWGLVPAIFKAKWNTNETLFTLMMNYVAIQLVGFFTIIWDTSGGAGDIGLINAKTEKGWFPLNLAEGFLGRENYLIHLVVILILTVIVYIYMNYSKHGFEISVVGESENTARYAGISVRRVIIRTMAISGALCGFAGFMIVGGATHKITIGTADGRGFTAIIVAWLAKFNPFLMIFYSFLIVFLDLGSSAVADSCHLSEAAAEMMTGLVLFIIIGSDFFANYKLVFRNKSRKEQVK